MQAAFCILSHTTLKLNGQNQRSPLHDDIYLFIGGEYKVTKCAETVLYANKEVT
jgi:hypothetical protein